MPQPLRVLSFNIRNGEADDGPNSWPHRREFACRTIRNFQPAIFGLQEVFEFQLRDIANAFPGFGWAGIGRDDGLVAGEFAPIFFDQNRFQLMETSTFWLSETPAVPGSRSWDTACTRICTVVVLRDGDGTEFSVFNLHLDHESELARERGVALVLSRIGPHPAILMGDFNAKPSDRAVRQIAEHGLIDTHLALHPESPNEGTFHGFDPVASLGDRIDYIFITPGINALDAQVIRDHDRGQYPSDHFPVGATISLSLAS